MASYLYFSSHIELTSHPIALIYTLKGVHITCYLITLAQISIYLHKSASSPLMYMTKSTFAKFYMSPKDNWVFYCNKSCILFLKQACNTSQCTKQKRIQEIQTINAMGNKLSSYAKLNCLEQFTLNIIQNKWQHKYF